MTDYWEKNKIILKSRGPQEASLANFLEDLDLSGYDTKLNSNQHIVLQVKNQIGASLAIDHPENPFFEVKEIVDRARKGTRLFLLMGVGLGYLFDVARSAFPNANFLVIEKDPRIFKSWLKSFDCQKILADKRNTFFVGIKPSFLTGRFIEYFSHNDHDLNLPAVSVLMNKRIVDYTRDYYESVAAIFRNSVSRYWDYYVGNDCDDNMVGLKHALINIKKIDKTISFQNFNNVGQDKIGIAVSAGPSLNESLPRLKAIADKAIIICADSVLHTLLEMEITPFGVACLERVEKNERLFQSYDLPKETILFAPPVIRPWVIENYPGPICFMNRWAFPFQWFPEWTKPFNYGTSCSHLAYVVLREMGCKEIALLGQDLAYAPTGESHFTFAHEVVSGGWEAKEKFWVECTNGKKIESNEVWISFRDVFQDFIAADQLSGVRVTNVIPSGYGAALTGANLEEPIRFFERVSQQGEIVKPKSFEKVDVEICNQLLSEIEKNKVLAIEKIKNLLQESVLWQNLMSANEFLKLWNQSQSNSDLVTLKFISEIGKPSVRRFLALINDPELTQEQFIASKSDFLKTYLPVLTQAHNILIES